MHCRIRSVCRCLLALGLAASLGAAAPEPGWKAGAARSNITPEKLMWMSGFGSRTKPADGKLTDLWAKALALEDGGGKRVVLVTMDLVGIDRGVSLRVCRELQKKYGLRREQIVLNVSHTHSGPVVGENLKSTWFLDDAGWRLVDEYTAGLEQKLVAVVGQALERLTPATLSYGNGFADFAVNRRNNKAPDVPRLRELHQLKGPNDFDVPVLAVRNPQGELQAVAFGYACHATTLSIYQWNGDYPGFTQAQLEREHPGVVALFWAGCGADQNALPRDTIERSQAYGARLATAVDAQLAQKLTPLAPRFVCEYREIPLPLGRLPTREDLQHDVTSTNKYIVSRARLLLAQLDRGQALSPTYPYPVEVWRLGDALTWIFLGGEVVVDYSLRLKRELGESSTWVAGYSNDVMAYIPSLRVLGEGGYEGATAMIYYGLPTAWSPAVEETIVKQVGAEVEAARIGR
ncbi:MAG TPA: neutral/alkaline non-lysosomal ceramidase N-terminal domain-containing protein [Pirellulales bacterium]